MGGGFSAKEILQMKTHMKTHKKAPFDPVDFVCPAEITTDRVQREVKQFEIRRRMDQYGFDIERSRFGLDVSTFMDHATQQMILTLKAKIASKKFDVKTVRFPDGPWQFIKFNAIGSSLYGLRIVRWFIKRYPVKYIEITMEANAYHPDIAIPDYATYVDIAMSAKREGY